eukprot:gene924-5185_t
MQPGVQLSHAVLHRPPPSIRPSACASILGPTSGVSFVGEATEATCEGVRYFSTCRPRHGILKPSQSQANPSQAKLQAYESAFQGLRYFSTSRQDKAGNKRKKRSFPKAAPIPQEKRAAELEAIQKELLTDLGMAQDVASKVMHVLQKYPAVLLVLPAALAQRLDRLASMGFPPGGEGGAFFEEPDDNQRLFNTVKWLTAKGFPEPLIQRMIQSNPTLLMTSPGVLGPMLEYVAWVVGSKETAVKLLTKQPSIFGKRPTRIHAKLLMLKKLVGCSPSLMLTRNYSIVTRDMHTRIGPRCLILRELGLAEVLMYTGTWGVLKPSSFVKWPTLAKAYQDMRRERFPTTNSLEEAIIVCQERWDLEWRAKFDERSLVMRAAWKVSGIAGLPTIGNLMCKEEE